MSSNENYKEEKEEKEEINPPILEIYEYKLSNKYDNNLWFTTISKNEKCGIIKDDYENEEKETYYRSCDLMDAKINYEPYPTQEVFKIEKRITNTITIDNITQKIFSKYPSRISKDHYNKIIYEKKNLFRDYKDEFQFETKEPFSILKKVLSKIQESMKKKNAIDISNKSKKGRFRVETTHSLYDTLFNAPDAEISSHEYKDILSRQYQKNKFRLNRFHIQKLIIPDKSVIFFCGDTHGSFHTTMRNILRLKYSGIIDNNFKILKSNFYMIFLGDIVDYGYLGYENLMTILLLKYHNHEKVFIIQGNHEEMRVHSNRQFGDELKLKFKDDRILNELTFHIEELFMKFPSAICVRSKSDSQWIWCCHGGLPITYVKNDRIHEHDYHDITRESPISLDISNFLKNNKTCFFPINYNFARSIKWNDFQSKKQNMTTSRDKNRGTMIQLGIDDTRKYMEKNNIRFIMRGHQDNYKNTKLLSSPDLKKNNLYDYTMIDINESENNSKWRECIKLQYRNKAFQNIIHFQENREYTTLDKKADSYLYRINISKFDNTHKDKCQVYPVLTLSTATSAEKGIKRDSFALLRYDIKNWKKNKLGYILSNEKHRLEFKTKITERAHRLGLAKNSIPKVPTTGGKTRKHQGIHQSGGKKGKLKKGYRYSGKKLKSGLAQIIKCKRKK